MQGSSDVPTTDTKPLKTAPNAAMAAMGPHKRLSCPQSFAHRLAAGLANRSRGRRISGGVAVCGPSLVCRGGLVRPRQVYLRTPKRSDRELYIRRGVVTQG